MSSSRRTAPHASGVDAMLREVGLTQGRRASRGGPSKNGEQSKSEKTSVAVVARNRVAKPGVVQVKEWKEFSWLKAGFSTREGGSSLAYSAGEYGEQNLGWTESDAPETVASNRERFVAAVAGKTPLELVTIRQTHTALIRKVHRVEAEHGPLATPAGKAILRGDALMTGLPGLLLGVQTADCVPVLVADTRRRVVAAFHAGWRGTLKRIVERGIGDFRLHYGSRPRDLVAAIGPCIGACCFAVGEEVRFEFESQFAYSRKLFSEVYDSDPVREKYPMLFLTARAPGHSNIGPQIHLDLVEANRRQLLDAGVAAKCITLVRECTACARLTNGRRKYFSHRDEHGFTGRMLSVIGMAKV